MYLLPWEAHWNPWFALLCLLPIITIFGDHSWLGKNELWFRKGPSDPMSGELSMFSFLFWRFRCKIVNLHLQAWSSTQTRTQTRTDLKLSSGFQIRKGNLDEDDGWLWLLSIFSWSTTYEDLLSTNQHFPRRIALAVSPLLLAQAPPFSAPVSAFDPACFFSRRWWIFWWTSGTKTGSSTEARGWFSLSLSL